MNRKNRTWQPIDPAAGGLPEGLESALGDGDSVSACVVVLVDSEIDSEWGALASLAIAKRWAESGRRVILADACLDRPVLHEVAGVENGEGVSDVMLLGASLERIAEPLGERLFLVPAGTPVDQVADVLTHIEWDIVIRGCKRAGATLVFHVSTGTPGAQSLTERAEGVLVLAPSSQDLDTIVGSESGPLIAVLGPGNRGDPSAAGLPGPALADPAGEGFGSDETPEPAFAEPGGGDFSLDEEDALAVEGLPELPEEPPAFSVDDPPELLSSEGEDGETSDAFSIPRLEGSQYDVGDSRDAALEADVPEAEAVVSEAEESTEASGTAEAGDVGVGTADLDSGADLEFETSVESETPLVEPVPVSDSLAEVGADGSPIEDALAVEGLPEEPPAFSVDDPPELPSSEGEDGETSDAFSVPSLEGSQKRIWRSRDLPEWSSSEGEDGETSDAFSVPSLEGSQYDAGDSRDGALEADAPEAGAVVSEAEESTEASGTAEGGDLGVGTEDLDSGADLQVETSVEGETALVEPLPVSDSPAEVGAEDSPTEEPQGESTEEDAEAGRGCEGPARVEKWRKTERKTELRTKRETKLKTERKTGRKTGQKTEWHVLLVDDDDDDYSLVIERSLRSAAGVPVEIRRARTGGEALTVLGDFVPDLLLLDLKMPGMGGHEVLERIKGDDKLRSVPVAVLSSSDRDEDVAKSYGFGGNHFITKPSNPLVLEAKLGALLRNLAELGGIRRGSTGASTTAVSAFDPRAMTTLKVLRWVVVVGALIALYTFGKVSGAF